MELKLSSTSAAPAAKKVVMFLQAVFGFNAKAASSVAQSLTELSKEKALDSLHIDDFLAFAKAAKQVDIDKAVKSKSIQGLKGVLTAIVKNKTFSGKLAAIKKFKFKSPIKKPSATKGSTAQTDKKGNPVDPSTGESTYKIPAGLTVLPEHDFFRGSAVGFLVGVSKNQLVELFGKPYKDFEGSDEWRIGYKGQPFALYSSSFRAPTNPSAPHAFSIRSKDVSIYGNNGFPKLASDLVARLKIGTFAHDVSEAKAILAKFGVSVKAGYGKKKTKCWLKYPKIRLLQTQLR